MSISEQAVPNGILRLPQWLEYLERQAIYYCLPCYGAVRYIVQHFRPAWVPGATAICCGIGLLMYTPILYIITKNLAREWQNISIIDRWWYISGLVFIPGLLALAASTSLGPSGFLGLFPVSWEYADMLLLYLAIVGPIISGVGFSKLEKRYLAPILRK